jgi:hypothetical protein
VGRRFAQEPLGAGDAVVAVLANLFFEQPDPPGDERVEVGEAVLGVVFERGERLVEVADAGRPLEGGPDRLRALAVGGRLVDRDEVARRGLVHHHGEELGGELVVIVRGVGQAGDGAEQPLVGLARGAVVAALKDVGGALEQLVELEEVAALALHVANEVADVVEQGRVAARNRKEAAARAAVEEHEGLVERLAAVAVERPGVRTQELAELLARQRAQGSFKVSLGQSSDGASLLSALHDHQS